MFGIGIFELILVFCVALIVLGPKQLPQIARDVGVWYYRFRNVAHKAQTEMEDQLHKMEDELKDDQAEPLEGDDGKKQD
jgi:sec-independent protein translocase protein TatB